MEHESEDLEVSEPVRENLDTRRRLVHRAVEEWKRQLIDLGGKNNLLYFRDLKAGTLDLGTTATSGPLGELLAGRKVRLSDVFSDPATLRDAARRARALRAKALENVEERGLRTLRLAQGFATWTSDRSSSTPNAPILLYGLDLKPTGVAADDFELRLEPEPELNPTLLHLLATDFNVHIGDAALGEVTSGDLTLDDVKPRLTSLCQRVPAFAISDRTVAGNFSYAKLPMVRDLDVAEDEIAGHDLLSAVAGDVDAREALRARQAALADLNLSPVPPPPDEFLVLDADSSQSYAIAAAVAGANLVVIGPPGTGKSQTISNLIATLVARGKSVLFVAEKRAAIEAVINRLEKQGLGDLLLDLHDGTSNRRRIAENLNRALTATRQTLEPDVGRLHQQLERRRDQLEAYSAALHDPTEAWGVSPFDVQARLIGLGGVTTGRRLRGAVLDSLSESIMAEARDDAQRFVTLGGAALLRQEGPWANTYAGKKAESRDAAADIQNALQDVLHVQLPAYKHRIAAITEAATLRAPLTLDDAAELVGLLADLDEVGRNLQPDAFGLDLPEIAEALRPARSLGPLRLAAGLFSGAFREARRTARGVAKRSDIGDRELLRAVELAVDVSERWRSWATDQRAPAPAADAPALAEAHESLKRALQDLVAGAAQGFDPETTPFDEIEDLLGALDRERAVLTRLPELHQLEEQIRSRGLGQILDEAVRRSLSPAEIADTIEYAWLSSIMDRVSIERPALAAFDSAAQESAVDEFRLADQVHIETAVDRVRRAWAERVVHARNEWPDEASLVAKQAALRRRHMPVRDFFSQAEHVLTAVKPCWVMSPLVVAQALPARACFDVVVFDEASQVPPSDAACALLRGPQAIIVGDPHQLPPTSFFSSRIDGDDEEEEEEEEEDDDGELAGAIAGALTSDIESILDVMRSLLPGGQRVLNWHYRSRDERLITFSNAQEELYDWSLTTFPGAVPGDCLRHVLVPFRSGVARVTSSVPEEAERVVELVIEHAAEHPDESLGLIALGSAHANRISELLRLAAIEHPEIAEMMEEEADEPLFVKNLERVQGDERDAIILTTGYSKTPDGRMRYVFGPLNQQGGHRRLNVAVTRARRRMTVVSSFSGREMDPDRLRSVGARMLRDFLLYAESGGDDLGVRAMAKPALNAFERDVQEQLAAQGIRLIPQFGASDYWIDFAVMHPERPSEPVLAIEADGASYHSAPSARDRDRLRQEHLERLGWRFHRIWSTDWFRHREREIERAVEAYRQAIAEDEESAPSVNAASTDPDPDWLPVPARTEGSRTARRHVRPGRQITEYSPRELRQVIRWVKSDGHLYTDEELLAEAMSALGFQKRGSRIVRAIRAAIDAERGTLRTDG